MTSYCDCGSKCPGYVSLRDPLNIFVCGRCLRPSQLVWLGSEKPCDECGKSIFSPWEKICSACQTVILSARRDGEEWAFAVNLGSLTGQSGQPVWAGWSAAAERARVTWPFRWSPWADVA